MRFSMNSLQDGANIYEKYIRYSRAFISLVASVLLMASLVGVWWYDIVEFTLPDPNHPGEDMTIRVHGGLFKTCAPATFVDEEGNLELIEGEEDCLALEDIAGTPIARSMSIGRGYITAGLVLASILALLELRSNNAPQMVAELYFVSFGVILAAFNESATAVVMTGFLVCNCADEMGRDGWISMACLGLYSLCFISCKKHKKSDRPKEIWWFYFFLQTVSFVSVLLLLVLDFFDSTAYFNPYLAKKEMSNSTNTFDLPSGIELSSGPAGTSVFGMFGSRKTLESLEGRSIAPLNEQTLTAIMDQSNQFSESITSTTPSASTTSTNRPGFSTKSTTKRTTTTRPRPTLPSLPARPERCAKKFSLWNYCDGFCDSNTFEVVEWKCSTFEEYPHSQIMWNNPVPTGITLNRIWLVCLILMVTLSMFFIREHSKKLRITLVANIIFAFTLLTNSYVYNLMESQAIIENDWTSHYEVNAHNSGPGWYVTMIPLCLNAIMWLIDTVYTYSEEPKKEEVAIDDLLAQFKSRLSDSEPLDSMSIFSEVSAVSSST